MSADHELSPELAPELYRELSQIDGLVAKARSELADGAVLDLTPLEQRVSQLCAGIQGLPAERGRPFAPRLVALLTDLEALGGQIRQGCEALSNELGDHGKRRSAVNAYGKGG